MRYRLTIGELVFKVANYTFLALLGAVTLYPFWYVIMVSFSDPVLGTDAYFWPKEFYYANYWLVFTTRGIGRAYLITVLRVAAAVPLMLLVTGSTAFGLTRKEMVGRKLIILVFFITMFFGGGLIPYYMLLKTVGLLNTFWVYVFPAAFSVWTMIVMKTSFQGLPEGLVESAIIDGASYMRVFLQIILPLSIPMLATLGLFAAVGHWNDWFSGAYYVRDHDLWPLQTFLQVKVRLGGANQEWSMAIRYPETMTEAEDFIKYLIRLTPKSLENAYIVVATIPILLVYPWVQRYFVKGVLIGSIKE